MARQGHRVQVVFQESDERCRAVDLKVLGIAFCWFDFLVPSRHITIHQTRHATLCPDSRYCRRSFHARAPWPWASRISRWRAALLARTSQIGELSRYTVLHSKKKTSVVLDSFSCLLFMSRLPAVRKTRKKARRAGLPSSKLGSQGDASVALYL